MEVNKIYEGDCIEIMKGMEENSVDTVITDPPYGLEFMGKDWDKFKRINTGGGIKGKVSGTGIKRNTVNYIAGSSFQEWMTIVGEEMLRVTKPGGTLLIFGGTRTYHRMAGG
ncbi:site-specific DNA-methyltransferase, partial [Patescibacteria group bacterium]|nr:site-specific DNA-methyltransferase [Patescibacteria group bacterium]